MAKRHDELEVVRSAARAVEDLNEIVRQVQRDDVRFVLIGEASHGTREFYDIRAELTKRLIRECGFSGVVGEADWPHAYRVNQYVNGLDGDKTAEESLRGLERFPQWMWRNEVVVPFVEWLRAHNLSLHDDRQRCGFYGMDLYSLYDSAHEVIGYLERTDPEAAKRARRRYECFEDFAEDTQAYGYAAHVDLEQSCEGQAVQQLVELQSHASERHKQGRLAADEFFQAEQNARLVKNAEKYYRAMFSGRVSSWNMRDRHMA